MGGSEAKRAQRAFCFRKQIESNSKQAVVKSSKLQCNRFNECMLLSQPAGALTLLSDWEPLCYLLLKHQNE